MNKIVGYMNERCRAWNLCSLQSVKVVSIFCGCITCVSIDDCLYVEVVRNLG